MIMSNYYNILGISKSASDEEIKNAYRKLARTHHPDKGGDKHKFQQIQEAYEILSDPTKRQNYDNPQGNLNNMFPFEFNNHHFFRHQNEHQIIKKNDYIYNCYLDLKDVYVGIQKKFRVQRKKICKNCKQDCSNCNGIGNITQHIQMGPFSQTVHQTCNICQGSGKHKKIDNCIICNNKNFIEEENVFTVDIKPGIESGTKIAFEEWGEQATRKNEISGAFIVNIIINDDPHFKRNGLNLIWTTTISLRESIIGKTIIIPHFAEPITIETKGFGIINPHKEYILYNRGLINEYGKQGDLYIRFNIEYKECNFTDEQISSLQSVFNQVNFY